MDTYINVPMGSSQEVTVYYAKGIDKDSDLSFEYVFTKGIRL